MKDITIIMMTPNRVPKKWAEFHKEKLMEAIGDTPIITISKEPLDWGINLLQTEYGFPNIIKQMLRAAKIATTKWIGTADDDTLYPKGHYAYRGEDGFHYNLNRWQLATWIPQYYFHRPVPGNGCMIATRELLIEKIEARLTINPALDKKYQCKELGTWNRWTGFDEPRYRPFYSGEPLVSFVHDYSADPASRHHNKTIYPVKAYDIPLWGRSEDLAKKFN
ncbi:MAG: hypothetical protein A2868_03470 [Candidatus Levybacteria bacterium RIFCSPHIGHO2_01_FULL_40_15b]|nr:MAG: hypothetical protein A2868_03470 [Candidatus Levybacteria bacterium RIFCSPHIGHO2_01_FULL_40_15b]